MSPATPSKKAYTDKLWNESGASNVRHNSIVPEDLTIALQNLGSRVRKSVTEGYNAPNLATFTVPATPFPSPAKPPGTQTIPAPIFLSANDALNSVFSPGSLDVPLTPSPKKRRRREELDNGESRRNQDSDVEMGAESEVDEDQVIMILGPDADSTMFSLPRKIKPLRRNVAQNRTDAVISNSSTLISQDGGTLTG